MIKGEDVGGAGSRVHEASRLDSADRLRARAGTTALAFRGYDVSNLGRSLELLEHPVYGSTVSETLVEGSGVASDALHRRIDLVGYVRAGAPTSLETFPEDVALIVAMEQAQIRVLADCWAFPVRDVKLTFGYSIGEMASLVVGGVYTLEQILPVPLSMAVDCAELAGDTHMGVLFTRGPVILRDDVERLCSEVSSQGKGLIGPSAYLSPNTALLLGQGDTLDRFESIMRGVLPKGTNLRRNSNHWPPLHTPLVWTRNIPNRTAVKLHQTEGGHSKPSPPILSFATGKDSYNEWNSRDMLTRWTDHPQQLWDVIHNTLAAGAQTIIHVGPEPKLISATFARLSNNINKHLGNKYLHMLGHSVVSSMNHLAWLARVLPGQTALLRAPFVRHIILEDWLLEQPIERHSGVLFETAAAADNHTGGIEGDLNPTGVYTKQTEAATDLALDSTVQVVAEHVE